MKRYRSGTSVSVTIAAALAASSRSISGSSGSSATSDEDVDVELAPDHGCEPEDPRRVRPEALDTTSHDVADALRQVEIGELAAQHPPSVVVQVDRIRVVEVAQELPGEERVAAGLPVERVGEPDPVLVELVPGGGRHVLRELVVVEPHEPPPAHAWLAVEVGEERGQRVATREVGVAVRAHEHGGERRGRSDDVA